MSSGITYYEDVARDLPENGPLDGVVLWYDDDTYDSSTTKASENDSIRNTYLYVSLPQEQPL